MSYFVDADHNGHRIMHQLHMGVLIMLNWAPSMWYLKQQNNMETSTFGSKFIALKTATEMVEGLHYKLCMIGIKVDCSTNIFCNNELIGCEELNLTRVDIELFLIGIPSTLKFVVYSGSGFILLYE